MKSLPLLPTSTGKLKESIENTRRTKKNKVRSKSRRILAKITMFILKKTSQKNQVQARTNNEKRRKYSNELRSQRLSFSMSQL